MAKSVVPIILAGGLGTRMKTERPKPLHEILGRPMIGYLMDSIARAGLKDPFVVAGYKSDEIRKAIKGVTVVKQKRPLGSADAVKAAVNSFRRRPADVAVLCCDTPFVKHETIKRLVRQHKASGAAVTVLTAIIDEPFGYGRIVRSAGGAVDKIVEEPDASEEERLIREVNVGGYCFNTKELGWALGRIRPDNRKKEYYLTDTVDILRNKGKRIEAVRISSFDEMLGINSRKDLAEAIKIKRNEVLEGLMSSGVTIIDPPTTWIDPDAKIGIDTVVHPHCVIEKDVSIARGCSIGPFSRVRKGVRLAERVSIGNFAELVRTKVGAGTKIKHMSYIGDATIGSRVNIGAGFIVANYDGKNKNKSVIGDGAFIGVGSILIAPARVGKRAVVGAGCVITKNFRIPDGSTVVGVPARILKRGA
ncbi:bifunctional N-acetylglucosamine-1-phosphate uridyltransferase/glucosamine-1-phosphate acetyltransferase [Candidatus Omnitrophota bacterium]